VVPRIRWGTIRFSRWFTLTCYGAAVGGLLAVVAPPVGAQRGLEGQIGTFLTRDDGWNWELNLVGRLGLSKDWSPRLRGVAHVTGRVSACPCGEMTQIPQPPSSAENGVGIGYDLQARAMGGHLASLVGVEWFQVLSEDQAQGGTLTGILGLGWYWGVPRHWGTELRYGAFGRRLSATRGCLEWTLVRRW